MKSPNATICCLALMGLGSALSAQEGKGLDFYFRMNGQAGLKGEGGQRNSFGLGFGANHAFGSGFLGVEAGYRFLPGNIYRAEIPANNLGADQTNSVVSHKNSTDMLGFRVQYTQPINADLSWNLGFGLYHSKARLESIGDFEASNINGGGASGDDDPGPDGVWNATHEKSGLAFMPYVGLTYKISESGSLELNLGVLNYKQADVTPIFTGLSTPYTRVTPSFGSKSVTDVKIEFAYIFHF